MHGFSAEVGISAAASEVFAFISKMENLPRYLPTVEKATRLGEDGVRLKGAANGRRYEVEGRLVIDPEALQMTWGSLEPESYSGAFQLFDTDEGCELACRIEYDPQLQGVARFAEMRGPGEDVIHQTLDDILAAVKQAVESRLRRQPEKPAFEPAAKAAYKLVF